MIKVLFVCLGNICRSPLAEAIFNHKVKEDGMQSLFFCDSAGTSDFHIGELPDERTLKCALRYNLPLNHRGRQVNRTDFRDFDYILAMDENNLRVLNNLKSRYGFDEKEVHLMRDFVERSKGQSVPDPYYGGEEGFEEIYQILDEAIENFLKQVKATHHLYA
ncbi:low molecular weight phosphotyrosine protein phosphatase [Algoriphagus halophytocola]|uniref:protein-tyrosine-phosphatase n=1 Tax=Algoriphagus halophytocola TaxID=2991499 RepID=A0ABY6MBL3_9BACT|nr:MULTISPECIES: low molecular weight protein-tyrosine-phosphatase [unclassified Algoriphagus]UZD20972.1 low molecular weight phosphotyrosine protein phosphatase [Algoriphagus sp. TR-M5]WBL42138.1 low molecular weight phosphotyrosine protein phosphatase [Algoriphagus sp. TR-M9]